MMERRTAYDKRVVAALAGMAIWCGLAQAAQLSLGAPRMGAQGWEAPVIMQPGAGESVASMQFDVALPQGFSGGAAAYASEAATLAGKQAIFSQVGQGQLRVVIAGLNQQPMGAGQVAVVQLGVGPEGQGAPGMLLHAPVLSSPTGTRIPVDANTVDPEPSPEPEPVDDDDGVAEEPEPETPPKENDPDPEPGPSGDDEGTDNGGSGGRNLNGYPPLGNGGGDFSEGSAARARQGAEAKKALPYRKGIAQQSAQGATTVYGDAAHQPYHMARNEPRGAGDRRMAERAAGNTGAHPDARQILGGTRSTNDAPAPATASADAAVDTQPFDVARGGRGGGGARGGMGRVANGATYGLAGAGAAGRYSGAMAGTPASVGTKIVMTIVVALMVGFAVWVYSLGQGKRRRSTSADE